MQNPYSFTSDPQKSVTMASSGYLGYLCYSLCAKRLTFGVKKPFAFTPNKYSASSRRATYPTIPCQSVSKILKYFCVFDTNFTEGKVFVNSSLIIGTPSFTSSGLNVTMICPFWREKPTLESALFSN